MILHPFSVCSFSPVKMVSHLLYPISTKLKRAFLQVFAKKSQFFSAVPEFYGPYAQDGPAPAATALKSAGRPSENRPPLQGPAPTADRSEGPRYIAPAPSATAGTARKTADPWAPCSRSTLSGAHAPDHREPPVPPPAPLPTEAQAPDCRFPESLEQPPWVFVFSS